MCPEVLNTALTDIKIKAAKSLEKPCKLSDSGGLYLLVNRNGSKYRRLKYRFAGKEKTLSIGVYPQVTLAEARNQRDEAKKLLAQNKDPSEEKQLAKLEKYLSSESTFEAVAREWHKSKADRWSLRYRDEIIDTFEKDILILVSDR